jgi:hypothetical protein
MCSNAEAGNLKGTEVLGRWWALNNKIHFKEPLCENMDWIYLARIVDKWLVLLNVAIKLWFVLRRAVSS